MRLFCVDTPHDPHYQGKKRGELLGNSTPPDFKMTRARLLGRKLPLLPVLLVDQRVRQFVIDEFHLLGIELKTLIDSMRNLSKVDERAGVEPVIFIESKFLLLPNRLMKIRHLSFWLGQFFNLLLKARHI